MTADKLNELGKNYNPLTSYQNMTFSSIFKRSNQKESKIFIKITFKKTIHLLLNLLPIPFLIQCFTLATF